ncbi:MAG: L,D-transpeptidase [Patescibacteria group bacterium]
MRVVLALCLASLIVGCQRIEPLPPPRKVVVAPPMIVPAMAAEEETSQHPERAVVRIRPAPVILEQPEEPAPRKIILINLAHGERGQYFIALEDGEEFLRGSVSGAITDNDSPLDYHPEEPHNHLGQFQITARRRRYHSRAHNCDMPYSLFFHNGFGHAIHACQPRDIGKLGQPASHGCLRVSTTSARRLFDWAGDDPVAVIITRE